MSAEERLRQMEQSDKVVNELRKEIEESTPYISEPQPLEILKEEYKDNKFEDCFAKVADRYSKVRRLRRDGNCFYRAFLFQLFEHFIYNKECPEFKHF